MGIAFYCPRFRVHQKAAASSGARAADPQRGEVDFDDGTEGAVEVGWLGSGVCCGSEVADDVMSRFISTPASP